MNILKDLAQVNINLVTGKISLPTVNSDLTNTHIVNPPLDMGTVPPNGLLASDKEWIIYLNGRSIYAYNWFNEIANSRMIDRPLMMATSNLTLGDKSYSLIYTYDVNSKTLKIDLGLPAKTFTLTKVNCQPSVIYQFTSRSFKQWGEVSVFKRYNGSFSRTEFECLKSVDLQMLLSNRHSVDSEYELAVGGDYFQLGLYYVEAVTAYNEYKDVYGVNETLAELLPPKRNRIFRNMDKESERESLLRLAFYLKKDTADYIRVASRLRELRADADAFSGIEATELVCEARRVTMDLRKTIKTCHQLVSV